MVASTATRSGWITFCTSGAVKLVRLTDRRGRRLWAITAVVVVVTAVTGYLGMVVLGRWLLRYRDNKQVRAFVCSVVNISARTGGTGR